MAESIIKLKVDSNEYESKLKRASAALISMADEAKRTGASLALADQQELAFVQSLGKLETSARGAKGTLGELSNTIQDLSMHYNKLSDEDRNSQYGQNLKKSIDELKARHKELKGQIDDTSKSMKEEDGVLESLAGKFGLNISQLTALGTVLAVGKAAFEGLKATVESTEATHDLFARTMQSCDSVVNQFFRSIANGDFSNFLTGLDDIIAKSIEAYNTLDDYESYMARFNADQQKMEAQIQSNLMKIRAAKAQGDNVRAEELVNQTKKLIADLANITKLAGQKQTDSAYATIKDLLGNSTPFTNAQIDWYASSKNFDEASMKASRYIELMDIINRASQASVSGSTYLPGMGGINTSIVQRTDAEKESAARAREELARDPSLKRAFIFQNLRDSGDSFEAQAFTKALMDLGGNVLAESRIQSLLARLERQEATIGRTKSSSSGKITNNKKSDIEYPGGSIGDLEEQISKLESDKKLQTTKEGVAAIDEQIKKLRLTIQSLEGEEIKPIDMSFSQEGITNYVKQLQDNFKNLVTELGNGMDKAAGEAQIKAIKSSLIDASTIANLFSTALRNGVDTIDFNGAELWKKILNKEDIPESIWQDIVKQINDKLSELGIGQIQLNTNTGTISQVKHEKTTSVSKKDKSDFEKATDSVSKSMNGLNQIAGGLKNMGVDLGEGFDKTLNVIQGLMSVIQGVQTFISLFSTTSMAANTAAIVANTSALVSNTVVNAIPFLAEGGVIPRAAEGLVVEAIPLRFAEGGIPRAANGIIAGSLFHGDTRPIRVNDGEMIINQTDQAKLYNAIHGDSLSFSNGGGVDVIRGENIYLSMRNYMKRTGRRLPV